MGYETYTKLRKEAKAMKPQGFFKAILQTG
jgi:hypothetical protein